jgi:hypothetical protein
MNFDLFVLLVYVVGYILTLLFLAAFGKSWFNINYDEWSKTESYYDDWDNNAQAYTAWSLFWPMLWFGSAIYFSIKLLVYISQFLINLTNRHESHPQKQEG